MDIKGYEDVDESQLDHTCIIDLAGEIKSGFLLLDSNPDHFGLVKVIDKSNNSILNVNPKRLKKDLKAGNMAIEESDATILICPECNDICKTRTNVKNTTCKKCGKKLSIVETIKHKSNNKAKNSKQHDIIDIKKIASSADEMWVRYNVPFNGETKVDTIVYRLEDKYISFNLYNGTLGKKETKPPIDNLKDESIGYKIKNIDKWRKKLANKGYIKFSK